ncbi:DUF6993 domain-containing protein [Microbacterium sp.]|uniref:DUF6993 domain-containing protein n=1 Tax=Microbacterium sp. TaxID=51671 RepID=UPI0037363C47
MRRPLPLRAPRTLIAATAIALVSVLSGCAVEGVDSAQTPSAAASSAPAPSAAAPSPSGTPSGAAATPDPAQDPGFEEFTAVVERVWSSSKSVAGRDYIDALVDAGFAKADMEVTFDRTSVDDPADSIQFSVRVDGGCLVGQVGPSVRTAVTQEMPELPTGACLVGETRPIDW